MSYLRALFARHGIAPRHRHGQNFLIDLNIHELIAKTAEVGPLDVVLEVGPGAGALTSLLAERAGAVIAVEIDPRLADLARQTVAGQPSARVINADILTGKHRLNAAVIDALRAVLAASPRRPLKLVANLPFGVATPLLTNLLVHHELSAERMVVTIQRELAERIVAPVETEAYGALSVLVQALADVELVRVLPPSVFWPRPKVESAVVAIHPRAGKRALIDDLSWFHAVVRRVFLHRRKHLRGVLASAWESPWSKQDVDALLGELGLMGQLRAEALDVAEWIALAEALKRRLSASAVARTKVELGVEHEERSA